MTTPAAQAANVLIRASAGTGKTFQLSNRFLQLASQGVEVDRILAATFARKAAGEIMERVLTRLSRGAQDQEQAAALAQDLELARTAVEFRALLAEMLRRLHRIRVSTLDSLLVQLARGFSLELGLPPGWSIYDEAEQEQLQERALESLLDKHEQEALQLVRFIGRATAGRSVASEVRQRIKEDYPLYLESEKAAWERLAPAQELNAAEIQAALAALEALPPLPTKQQQLAHAKHLEAARQGDWAHGFSSQGLVHAIVADGGVFSRRQLDPAVVQAYQPLIQHARAVYRNQIRHRTEATWRLLDLYHQEYQQQLRQARRVGFDDLARLLGHHLHEGALGDVAHRLDAHVRHWLLDEFQDTSLAQWQVVARLTEPIREQQSGCSLFCVGDGKQAIYGWRGGVAEVFEALRQAFPGIGESPLDKSYRSSQAVIDVVNRVFGGLPGLESVQSFAPVAHRWHARFRPHETARSELPGCVTLEMSPECDEPKLAALACAARRVQELAAAAPGRSIGVLVRRNAMVDLLIELLRKQGLAASEEGGTPLHTSPAVRLVLSALTLADHPHDRMARFHLARSPWAAAAGFHDFDDDRLASTWARATRARLQSAGYGRTIHQWVRQLAPCCGPRDVQRLLQLVEVAWQYDDQATPRSDDFVRHVHLLRVEDPSLDPVRVMTIHKAKGLEFDAVVLAELDWRLQGQVPPSLAVDRPDPLAPVAQVCSYVGKDLVPLLPEDLRPLFSAHVAPRVAEALCVLYVAMTRAKHALHLILPPGGGQNSTPARLLSESLAPGKELRPGTVLFAHGDPGWARHLPAETAAGPPERVPWSVHLRPSAGRRRTLEHESPSTLGPLHLAEALLPAASAARVRGTLFHRWLEQIEWLDKGPPDEVRMLQIGRALASEGLDLPAELAEFRRLLDQEAIRQLLLRSSYSDPARLGFPPAVAAELAAGPLQVAVFRERPLAVRLGDQLLSGTVDRLVVFRRGDRPLAAEVIDFKSDAAPPAAADRLVERYRPQLAAYQRGLARSLALDSNRVVARLALLAAGLVRRVEA
jgi:ATP-dependent exoDNAse (exonuclease V) beta subunit